MMCLLVCSEVVNMRCCLVFTWLVPHEIAAILAHFLRTPCSHVHHFYGGTSLQATRVGCIHCCIVSWCDPQTIVPQWVKMVTEIHVVMSHQVMSCCDPQSCSGWKWWLRSVLSWVTRSCPVVIHRAAVRGSDDWDLCCHESPGHVLLWSTEL